MKKTKVLILGGTGMLGHILFTHLSQEPDLEVSAGVRNIGFAKNWFTPEQILKLTPNIDAAHPGVIDDHLRGQKPDVVINCIGLVKQIQKQQTQKAMIAINAVFPHQIANYCGPSGTRFIHISTDCVFAGTRGNYQETDPPDPIDLYGVTKLLGEVDYPNCLTLRTSIIGHELRGRYGLVEWFLAQSGPVNGYTQAIYSGLPTIELARVIAAYVLPHPELRGLIHLSSAPISKYDLLTLIRKQYGKSIRVEPEAQVKIDRSLNSTLFCNLTGYQPPSWDELVYRMYRDYRENPAYHATRRENGSDAPI